MALFKALGVLAASPPAHEGATVSGASGDTSLRPGAAPSRASDMGRVRQELAVAAAAILGEARALHRHAVHREQGIEGVLLKKGRIGFQQRYFTTKVSHYLLYRNSESEVEYAGGVDLAGPQSTVTLSEDLHTLTVVGRDAAARGTTSTERSERTLTLRAPMRATKHTLAEWADHLRTSMVALSAAAASSDASESVAPDDIDGTVFVAEEWAEECGA